MPRVRKGRPGRPSDGVERVRVSYNIPTEIRDRVEKAASSSRRSASAYVVMVLAEHFGGSKELSGDKDDAVLTAIEKLAASVHELRNHVCDLEDKVPALEELEELMRHNPDTPLRFIDIQRRFGFPRVRTLREWRDKGRLIVNPSKRSQTSARHLWNAIHNTKGKF